MCYIYNFVIEDKKCRNTKATTNLQKIFKFINVYLTVQIVVVKL